MRKTSLLAGAALLLGAYTATAAEDYTCATPPTCAELGYDQSPSDCAGKKTIKCPFDTEKVFCGGDCVSEGYTSSNTGVLTLTRCCVGQTKVTCPYDSQYYKCTGTCTTVSLSCEALGYTYCDPSGGTLCACLLGQTYETCSSDSNYYKCTGDALIVDPVDPIVTDSCASGFLLSDTSACGNCTYGIISNGTTSTQGNTCYRCGTKAECGCYTLDNGLSVACKCLMCAATAAVQ